MSNLHPHVAEKSPTYEVLHVLERSARWPRVPLTEAVDLNPKPERGSMSDELQVSFVPMAAVEAGTGVIDASTVRKYAEVKKGYTYFHDGDVLFAKITPCMENGKMAVARQLRNGIGFGSTEFHVLRPREGVDAHYVYHFVSSARFRAEAAHHMTGAVGQKRVPTAYLEQSQIPLPPIDQQRRIVAEIEKQFSRFEQTVATLKRVQGKATAYKAACLRSTVHASGSESWPAYPLGELGELNRGKSKHRPRNDPILYGGRYPFIQTGDIATSTGHIKNFRQTYSDAGLAQSRLWPKGTLCITIAANIADTAILSLDACFPDSVVGFLPGTNVLVEWVNLAIRAQQSKLEREAPATAQKNINLEVLRKLLIPVPSLQVQRHLLAELERCSSVVETLEEAVKTNLVRAERLRQRLLATKFHFA